jgi:hypothetical protein
LSSPDGFPSLHSQVSLLKIVSLASAGVDVKTLSTVRICQPLSMLNQWLVKQTPMWALERKSAVFQNPASARVRKINTAKQIFHLALYASTDRCVFDSIVGQGAAPTASGAKERAE